MGSKSGERQICIQIFHTGIVMAKLGCQRLASEPVVRIIPTRTDGGKDPPLCDDGTPLGPARGPD